MRLRLNTLSPLFSTNLKVGKLRLSCKKDFTHTGAAKLRLPRWQTKHNPM